MAQSSKKHHQLAREVAAALVSLGLRGSVFVVPDLPALDFTLELPDGTVNTWFDIRHVEHAKAAGDLTAFVAREANALWPGIVKERL